MNSFKCFDNVSSCDRGRNSLSKQETQETGCDLKRHRSIFPVLRLPRLSARALARERHFQSGMEGSKVSNEAPNAWLWQDVDLADVSLEVVFITPVAPSESCGADTDKEDLSTDAQDASNVAVSTEAQSTSVAVDQSTAVSNSNSIDHSQQIVEALHTKTYVLHSPVLGSNSGFLRSMLTSGVGSAKRKRATENGVSRLQISVQVDAEHADTVDVLLEYFYLNKVSDGLQGSDLLKLLQMADKWQAPLLLTHSIHKLLSLDPCTFPIIPAFSLPSVLRDSTAFSVVMAQAEVLLLRTFKNAPDIIRSPVLMQKFVSLPQPALVALLESSEFETDAEESVLLLVSSWLADLAGKACSARKVRQLQSLIRYSQISAPYLTCVCDVLHLPELTRTQVMELYEFRSLPFGEPWDKHINPAAWYLPARSSPTLNREVVNLKLVFTAEKLKQLLAGAAANVADQDLSLVSTGVYSAGFIWTLNLELAGGELWATVCVRGLADVSNMDSGLKIPHGVYRAISIQIEAHEPCMICRSNSLVATSGRGVAITLEDRRITKGASGLDWWARFIVDGSVTLTATVQRALEESD